MSVRFCTLFSGSKANSAFIEHISADGKRNAILIDAGAGVKTTERALAEIGSGLSEVGAIFVTHEHTDHIGGLKTILKKYSIPVAANAETVAAIRAAVPFLGNDAFIPLPPYSRAANGVFEVIPFDSSHDSARCSGYIVRIGELRLGYLTDCGAYNERMLSMLDGCRAVILESNHDPYMLNNGIYPPYLKKRIASEFGHLSNDQCASALCRLARSGVKSAILAHLSKENNTPEVAEETVCGILRSAGLRVGTDISVYVAPADEHSRILEF